MTKWHSVLGYKEPKLGDVGLELEVEALNPPPVVNEKSWKTKEDGSLRHFGAEYVSKGPIKADHTKLERLQYLCDKLNQPEVGVVHGSPRTSFHVHVNVMGYTPVQIWTAATAYWLLENLLMRHCGHDREGNLFCLRLADAGSIVSQIQKDIKQPETPFSRFGDRFRYMALNLKPVRDFGSIEFRGMRGTTDAVLMHEWSSSLHSLVANATQLFRNPAEVVDSYFRGNDLTTELLSINFANSLKLQNNDWSDLIDENLGAVAEFAYAADWTKYEERFEKVFANPLHGANPQYVIIDDQVNPLLANAWGAPVQIQLRNW